MALPGIRYDDGSGGFASTSFPVRTLIKPSDDDTGAWLVAHKVEQRRRFKAVLCSKPRTFQEIRNERKKAEQEGTATIHPTPSLSKVQQQQQQQQVRDEEEEDEEIKVLDGFFLMKHCCVEDPSDLCSINISGQGVSEVKEDDLQLFDNTAYINAAENLLTLEPFRSFPILRELEMPLNGLRGIHLGPNDFPHLEMLDLSFNNLAPDDLLPLGNLPNLRVLHLTGNSLKILPTEMCRPWINERGKRAMRFAKLEILMLDDNKLTDLTSFATLAGLRKLRHLNLSKNDISSVPQLVLIEGRHVTQQLETGSPSSRPRKTRSARSTRRSRAGLTPGGGKSDNSKSGPGKKEPSAKVQLSDGRHRREAHETSVPQNTVRMTETALSDAEHVTDMAPSDTEHVTETALPDTEHMTEMAPSDTEHVTETALPDTEHVTKKASPDTEHVTEMAPRETVHVTERVPPNSEQTGPSSPSSTTGPEDSIDVSVEKHRSTAEQQSLVDSSQTSDDSTSDLAQDETLAASLDIEAAVTMDTEAGLAVTMDTEAERAVTMDTEAGLAVTMDTEAGLTATMDTAPDQSLETSTTQKDSETYDEEQHSAESADMGPQRSRKDLQEFKMEELNLEEIEDEITATMDLPRDFTVHSDDTDETQGQGRGAAARASRKKQAFEHELPLPPPFPVLRHLNISHNKVCTEESLLAVAAWPMLSELVMHDNPLTIHSSGDPPLLKRFLTERLGVYIQRKRPGPLEKPHVEVHPKPHRRVVSHVPKVPKCNVEELLALEAPKKPYALTPSPMPTPTPPKTPKTPKSAKTPKMDASQPLPPITPTPEGATQEAELAADSQFQGDAFFMTQIDDPEKSASSPKARPVESKELPRREKRTKKKTKKAAKVMEVEDKYKGYESLLEVDEEAVGEQLPMPKDIQGNLRALKYSLNHPLVFREENLQLDEWQAPYRPWDKAQVAEGRPVKTRAMKVAEVLENVKNCTTVLEENLDTVLKSRNTRGREFPEAETLLGEVQRRYNKVRVSSMGSVRTRTSTPGTTV